MPATARSQSTDPFSVNKFHVVDTQGILNLASPAAGFSNCTAPEVTIAPAEYQEGIEAYRRKYPGEPTFPPVVLSKGLVKNDTTFYAWVLGGIQNQPYRTNLIIKHYHRDDVTGLVNYQNATPYRELHLRQAMAVRVRTGGDFDTGAGEISIEELEIEYEFLDLFINGQQIKALTTGSQ